MHVELSSGPCFLEWTRAGIAGKGRQMLAYLVVV